MDGSEFGCQHASYVKLCNNRLRQPIIRCPPRQQLKQFVVAKKENKVTTNGQKGCHQEGASVPHLPSPSMQAEQLTRSRTTGRAAASLSRSGPESLLSTNAVYKLIGSGLAKAFTTGQLYSVCSPDTATHKTYSLMFIGILCSSSPRDFCRDPAPSRHI